MPGGIVGSMFLRHNTLVAGRYPYTASGWIRFPSGGADGYTQFLPTGINDLACVRLVDRLQLLRVTGYDDTGVDLTTDTWWYVALVVEETSQRLYLAADGDAELTLVATFTNTLTSATTAGNHQLHYRDESSDHNVLYQWRGWNSALTKAQLDAEAAAATPVITSDLVHDYRFATGALDQDSSGNGYNINVGGASLTEWTGALPSFGGGGATYADGTAFAFDGDTGTVVPAAHIAGTALSSDGDVDTASPAAHVAVTATSLDRVADTGGGALHVAATAYAFDGEISYAGPAAAIAALATSADGEAAQAALTLFATALAASSDGELAAAGGALHASVTATSADGGVVAAAISAAVSALAASTDAETVQGAGALLVSALATSMDAETARVAGALIVHGTATSLDDALAIVDLAYEMPAALTTHQTRSRAVPTLARSRAVATIARSAAA